MSLNFSDEQKIILMNQFSILEDLSILKKDNDSAEEYANAREGIAFGYGDWALEALPMYFDDEVSENDKQFVLNALDMYSDVYAAYNRFDENQKNQITLDDIEFIGFDGNEDTYGFYSFITRKLNRFNDVVKFIEQNGWEDNSHGYDGPLKDMVQRYKKIDSKEWVYATPEQKFQFVKDILGK